jgi:tetratricopeptide (TPR) repeat protein
MRKTAKWNLPFAMLLVASLPLAAAQQGRILGTVTDGKGAPLEGAKITITTPAITNFKVELMSNKDGKWGTILNDSTLKYHYHFEKQGYISTEQDKKVPIGSTEELNVQLMTQEQAIEKGLIKQVVDPFTAAYNEAVEKFQADDLAGSLSKAEEAMKLGPEKALAFDLATKVAHKTKNWDKTVEYGEKALTIEPDNPPLLGLLADAWRQKGNAQKAGEYEKKYASANPDQPEVLYNQAIEKVNKGDMKGAEPLLKKAVEAKPDYADGHYQLGMVYMNLNKPAELKKHFGEYLRIAPTGKYVGEVKEILSLYK